ncbi:MAG: hypothetical protein HY736_10925 [Verrucomicrobia bacterium]|nr:hypothetical protein [Verrucomicrobiota bacterium]
MSFAEVKEHVERLTPSEREELAALLRAKKLIDSPEYRERVMRAEREIDAGKYVTLEQLRELVAKNQAARRAS